MRRGKPHHFWVAEIADARVFQYRVVGILCPAFTLVKAIGEALVLKVVSSGLLPFRVMMCKYRHQWHFATLSKTGRITGIDHRAARKNISQAVGVQSNGQFLPMHYIAAHGMPPVHRPPVDTA